MVFLCMFCSGICVLVESSCMMILFLFIFRLKMIEVMLWWIDAEWMMFRFIVELWVGIIVWPVRYRCLLLVIWMQCIGMLVIGCMVTMNRELCCWNCCCFCFLWSSRLCLRLKMMLLVENVIVYVMDDLGC